MILSWKYQKWLLVDYASCSCTLLWNEWLTNLKLILCLHIQGTYVLQDNRFALLTQLSCGKQYMEDAPKVRVRLLFTFLPSPAGIVNVMMWRDLVYSVVLQYLAFSCGLLRGALSNLGLESVVTAEVSLMPACKCPMCHTIIKVPLSWPASQLSWTSLLYTDHSRTALVLSSLSFCSDWSIITGKFQVVIQKA